MVDGQKQIYEFGQFRLDLVKRQLTRSGEVVPLYSKAFDLLTVLVQNGGRDLTKDELLESVWPGQVLEEANLTVTMSAVRKALGEKATRPHHIVTIPGRGYRFVGSSSESPAVLLASETISQITVAQETESDNDARPADDSHSLPAASVHTESALARATSLTPVSVNRPVRWRWVTLGVGALIVLVLVVLGSAYALRRITATKPTVRFSQVKLAQVTNSGRIVNVALSPDGKLFGYAQQDKEKMSLHLGDLSGEKQIELLPPADAVYRGMEYAKDGGSLYYARQENGQGPFALYKISVLGGVPTKMCDNLSPYFSLSPDQKQVAFIRNDEAEKTSTLNVSKLDGSNETALLRVPFARGLAQSSISWSPDGAMLAFSANVAQNDRRKAIMSMPVAGGPATFVTANLWREIMRMIWTKDGRGLLAVASSTDPQETRQIWFIPYPGGEARRVTADVSIFDWGLSVSSDPNSFLLVQHKQSSNLWMAPANDFNKARQITFSAFTTATANFSFDWLPNNRIVYASGQGSGLNIWSMDPDGSNSKEITAPGFVDAAPSASADGRFIAFQSNRSGLDEIWRVDVDGGKLRQLTTCGRNSQPTVSPDGKWIVYRSSCDGTGTLWRVPGEGGQPVRLTDKSSSWPWISPDGRWIACGYQSGVDHFQLAILPFEGGEPTKLFDVPPLANFNFSLRWSRDGKSITYRDWGKGLWRQSIDGGPPQRIPGLPDEKLYYFSWSPDNKLFVFTRGVEIRDAVLVSNSN